MKYVVRCDNEFAQLYAQLVIKEIDRFDYRAAFLVLAKESEIASDEDLRGDLIFTEGWKHVKRFQPDAYLDFSVLPDFKLARKAKRMRALTYFFQLTRNKRKSTRMLKKANSHFDKVHLDLPLYPRLSNTEFSGHFLTDLIRYHNPGHKVALQEDERMHVIYLCATTADKRLADKLSGQMKNDLIVVKKPSMYGATAKIQFVENLTSLKAANAAIIANDFDEMLCAFTSCPAVRVKASGNWFPTDEYSLVGKLIDQPRKATSRKSMEILTELNLLLSDHQICANRLAEYQKALEIVGNNPVIRTMSQEITQELEDRS